MRPGVFEVRASPFLPTSALISDDLPTFERPAKAISGGPSGGRKFIAGTLRMKTQGRAKISAPAGPVLFAFTRLPPGANVGAANGIEVAGDLVDRPVPPGDAEQAADGACVEARLDHLGRVAGDDRVGRHVMRHDRLGRDDRAVADRHAGHDHRFHADPDIIAETVSPRISRCQVCGIEALLPSHGRKC